MYGCLAALNNIIKSISFAIDLDTVDNEKNDDFVVAAAAVV